MNHHACLECDGHQLINNGIRRVVCAVINYADFMGKQPLETPKLNQIIELYKYFNHLVTNLRVFKDIITPPAFDGVLQQDHKPGCLHDAIEKLGRCIQRFESIYEAVTFDDVMYIRDEIAEEYPEFKSYLASSQIIKGSHSD